MRAIISSFFFKSLFIYLILISLGLALKMKPFIAESFRSQYNRRFHDFDQNTYVKFLPLFNSAFDTRIFLKYTTAEQNTTAEYLVDTWYMSYISRILFISLILATRFPSISKKALAFAGGYIITTLLIYVVFYIRIYILKIQAQEVLGVYGNTLYDRIIVFFHNNIAVYGWICFVIPAIAWLLVAFRKDLLQRNFGIVMGPEMK